MTNDHPASTNQACWHNEESLLPQVEYSLIPRPSRTGLSVRRIPQVWRAMVYHLSACSDAEGPE